MVSMGHPAEAENEARIVQAKILRGLAERLENGEESLPTELEEALVRALEDRLDRAALHAARQEQGRVSLDEIKAKLGLSCSL
jgi:hypothetical protein